MPKANRDPKYVRAIPAKRFFVGMLVKDIELVPAIIDLVDNSIDGGKRLRPKPSDKRYKGLKIEIDVSGDRFAINDNCGGIDLDWARDYAFRFGRPDDIEGPLGEVGQFGVGMKRALFKLGRNFTIKSRTKTNRFTLPVSVNDWMADKSPDWSFELSDVNANAKSPVKSTGTSIEVRDLYPTISTEMGTEQFANRLRDELRLRQARIIAQGMSISVNGSPVEQFTAELTASREITPIFVEQPIETDDKGVSLEMKLYAGLVHLRETDAERDDDDAEEFRQPPEAGWYLYCNDRLLLAADRTRLTGWGSAAAAYHPQYRQFRGYVFLAGEAKYMPWTTTKTSVDEDNPVFRAVQAAMFDALTKTQAAMNRIKKERQSNAEGERPAFDAMRTAKAVPLANLTPSTVFEMPAPAVNRPSSNIKWIRYSVDPEDFEAVAEELDVTAAVDVGRGTFEYYLETQVPK